MKDKLKESGGQLFNYAPGSYLERTSRPIYGLLFLLPFIVFYELGTIFLNTDVLDESQVRVVAFVWLQQGLEYIGLGGKFAWAAPPLMVVMILLAFQVASKKSWRFIVSDVWPMAIECALMAAPLIVLSLFLNGSSIGGGADVSAATAKLAVEGDIVIKRSVLADIVTGIGAGIYEELVFRLVLICLLMLLLQDLLNFSHRNAIILSVIISAALFSAHHHIVFVDGELGHVAAFSWTVFVFRAIAGVYFAALFAMRGFGIAAGTHAFYDIIATLINAAFFPQP